MENELFMFKFKQNYIGIYDYKTYKFQILDENKIDITDSIINDPKELLILHLCLTYMSVGCYR